MNSTQIHGPQKTPQKATTGVKKRAQGFPPQRCPVCEQPTAKNPKKGVQTKSVPHFLKKMRSLSEKKEKPEIINGDPKTENEATCKPGAFFPGEIVPTVPNGPQVQRKEVSSYD